MLGRREKFLRILRIELEDLEDHIPALIKHCREKAIAREITEYVCLENTALLRNEALAFHHFDQVVDAIRPDECEDLPELVEELMRRFETALRMSGLAHAAGYLVAERMRRVFDYVMNEDSVWNGYCAPEVSSHR